MMASGIRGSTVVACVSLLAGVAHANTLHVPGDASTIQGAIDLAADDDMILVAPGTYPEAIDFQGKQLVVRSLGGAAVTTIDGTGMFSSVASLDSAEPAGAALRGFTITGGNHSKGGGVYVGNDAHLSLQNCIITGNTAQYGGGFAVELGTATLMGCTLTDNVAEYGPAMYLGYSDEFSVFDCVISANSTPFPPHETSAAVFSEQTSFIAANCVIEDNLCGGLRGIYPGYIIGCTFRGNDGWGVTTHAGSVFVEDCAFLDNSLGGFSLSIDFSPNGAFLTRCIFAPGQVAYAGDEADVEACIFDGAKLGANSAVIRNSIARNVEPFGLGWETDISYSDIEGGAPGPGNIDADPLWVDPAAHDYHLQPGSPCINTGDPVGPLNPDGSPPDMGALPYEPWTWLDGGVAGTQGQAELAVNGPLTALSQVTWSVSHGLPGQPVVLVVGAQPAGLPFHGGIFWPEPQLLVALGFDAAGGASGAGFWPVGIPSATGVWLQAWFKDPGGTGGLAASYGVKGIAP